jgi:hypothetical protein
MSLLVTLNSVNYIIPTPSETGWGTNLDNFFVGIAAGCLQKSGGSFTLAADVNFGPSFGLLGGYFTSISANAANAGLLRATKNDTVSWRNNANNANLALAINASDKLTFNGNVIASGSAAITPNSFVYGDASGNLGSTSNPTNGQLLIGSTGAIPAVATLTGTTNQVNVTTGAGSITLSLPQNIHAAATPIFSNLTLSALSINSFLTIGASGAFGSTASANNGELLIGSTGALPVKSTITGTTNQVIVSNGAGSIMLSLPQNIHTAATPTFAGLTDTGLAANTFIYSGTSSLLTATAAPTNGQLLVGSTGAAPVAATLTGTTSQVIVTNGAGTITLSTPQSIATSSSPTFAALTLTAALTVANGGTGLQSTTAYAVICGGTTSTNPLQSIASVGSSGQVLTSNGAGALPTFQNVSGTGTVNSGTAGRLSLYNTSTNAVSDTYVQNAQNITLAIAAQASRSAALAITLPNPGNAVTTANVLLDSDTNSYTVAGAWTLSNNIAISKVGTTAFTINSPDFIVDSTNHRVGIGVAPAVTLHVQAPGPDIRFQDSTSSAVIRFLPGTTCFIQTNTNNALSLTTNNAAAALTIDTSQNVNIPNTKAQTGGNQNFPIVQIIQGTSTTEFDTTSTTYVTTNLTATITPKFNTSKILIQVSGNIAVASGVNADSSTISIFRGATNLELSAGSGFSTAIQVNGQTIFPVSIVYYDSPATTSATVYSIKLKTSNVRSQASFGWSNTAQIMVLTEVAQ